MHCVDLGESFPTSISSQNLASIQPRTSLVKFVCSPRTDNPGYARFGVRVGRKTLLNFPMQYLERVAKLTFARPSGGQMVEMQPGQVVKIDGLWYRRE